MFTIGSAAIRVPSKTAKGRTRRVGQLAWTTLVRDKCHKPDMGAANALADMQDVEMTER